MKLPIPALLCNSLIGVIILSLCMMPLLGMGKHIHLAETHMGQDMHKHESEAHGFHLHHSNHDSIDTDIHHPSDTQQVDIELNRQLGKFVKLLASYTLASIFLITFVAIRSISLPAYISPYRETFEIFTSMLRGPPTV